MKPGLKSRLAKLLDRLAKCERRSQDDDEIVQDHLAAAIRELPREGLVKALREVIGNNKRRRRAAMYLLGELTDVEEVAGHLGELLLDPAPEWRAWLIQTIADARLSRYAGSLNAILDNDPDPLVRQTAVHAAGTLKSQVNLPALLRLAENPPPELRSYLLWALKEYAHEDCRPLLNRAFQNPCDKETKIIAAWGLGKLGDRKAVECLGEMLDAESLPIEHRLRAAQALCDIHAWPFTWHKDWVGKTRERWCLRKD